VGEPAENLHARAHELEHIHDPVVVSYLDDLLVHPQCDPHGQTIPDAQNPACPLEYPASEENLSKERG
jgi:Mn-dependent DtxR family transcriptional regulator